MRTIWIFTIAAFLMAPAFGQTKTPEEQNNDLLILKCSLDAVCHIATQLVHEDDEQWKDEWREQSRSRQVGLSDKEAREEQNQFVKVGVKHNEEIEDCEWVIIGLKLDDLSHTPLPERQLKAKECAARYIARAKAIVDARDAAKDANRK